MIDDRIVGEARNLRLQLGKVHKSDANPLFAGEFFAQPPKAWEARYDNLYPSVCFDPTRSVFQLWYNIFIRDEASEQTPPAARPSTAYWRGHREEGLLYAESVDGLRWEKPELGIVSFNGSTRNNMVMDTASHGLHGVGVLRDAADPDRARRYKAFLLDEPTQRMAVAFSPDGLHWTPPLDWDEHTAIGDAHPNTLRLPDGSGYVGFMRGLQGEGSAAGHAPGPQRLLRRTVSRDFVHWSQPEVVLEGSGRDDQIYSMPVAYMHGIYLGLPAIFHAGDRAAPNWDAVDTELAWSHDSQHWQRVCPGTALIPRGPGSYPNGGFDCGCIYAAAPLLVGDQQHIYYAGSDSTHTGFRDGSFCLATLPQDRFAGYAVADSSAPGLLTTAALLVDGPALAVNVDTGNGSLRVAVHAANGSPIPGFALDDCKLATDGGLAVEPCWAAEFGRLRGRQVRLVFELRNAVLFAFGFA
jgi:hypothetical protein